MADGTERCLGCDQIIQPGEPRIHIGIDEWGQAHGEPAIGLGDLEIRVPFCDDCTKESDRGWIPTHEALEQEHER